jgi:3D (Asp-Asp-Asp) domain-containing protein
MTRLKRFKIGLFTITLGMVLVGASFALADDKAAAEGIILPEELNETTAILAPSVAIVENEPTTPPEERIDAVATAYCPCEICCGKWALNRPDDIVYTASGAIAEEGVTIAADWSVYSPGTILYIEGIGERTVQDRGGAISGQKIDVFFNNHEDALRFGRQEVRIKVISDTER